MVIRALLLEIILFYLVDVLVYYKLKLFFIYLFCHKLNIFIFKKICLDHIISNRMFFFNTKVNIFLFFNQFIKLFSSEKKDIDMAGNEKNR